jgi:hypothetical protein
VLLSAKGRTRCGELVIEDFFNHGFETRSLPPSLAATRRGFAFYVADPLSSIETRSLPPSLAATRRGFAFYVADPLSSIETRSFPNSLTATFVALPSISLFQSARFADCVDEKEMTRLRSPRRPTARQAKSECRMKDEEAHQTHKRNERSDNSVRRIFSRNSCVSWADKIIGFNSPLTTSYPSEGG